MKAKAAIVTAPDTIIFDDVDVREPKGNEVAVKITAVGICGTDMTGIHGYTKIFPGVYGHEGAGVVEAVGPDVTKFKVGDRVGITYTSCGSCKYCQMGRPNACDTFMANFHSPGRLQYKGSQLYNWFGQNSFSTHTLTLESNLTRVPEGLDPDLAGPFGCGIMTGYGFMMDMNPQPDGVAVILGLGTVGMAGIMAAKNAGVKTIIAVGGTAWKQDIARELGATHIIDRTVTPDIAAAVRAIAPNGGDYILETTGRNSMVMEACKFQARLGTIYFAAVYHEPITILPLMQVNGVYKQGTMGNWDAIPNIEMLMQLSAEGKLPVEKLVKYYKFDEMEQAIDDLEHQRVIKPILKIED